MSTERTQQITFGPFRLDPSAPRLWRGEQALVLQPKPLAVLLHLAQCPGQVVTKQELLKAVWTGTVVTNAVVKECVHGIRDVLGETAEAPQYLHTEGREGYRFFKEASSEQNEENQKAKIESQPPAPLIVGREADLAHLHKLLDKALRGEPQFVFITGELGIGKTAVVDAFRTHIQALGTSSLGYGQCIEHYGPGEPYLPVLEAMSRLCREEGGQQLITLLRKHAPTWLVQLSGVIEETELQTLRLHVQGATQQRMLREIAEAIEVGTVGRPLVLMLEDLHWSDSATIEVLAYLAKRRHQARLLVVGTYRPIDAVMQAHPIKTLMQELQAHGLCEEVRLELLKKQEIEAYIAGRFPKSDVASVLAPEVYRRTEGNPLFMVNVVEHFLAQGLIGQEDGRWAVRGEVKHLRVPASLRQLIAQQVERLSEEQRQVLEGASIAGAEFPVAAVAATGKQEVEEVETMCEEITGQGHFLEERGVAEWPDGTISGRYAFRHVLYQNVLWERIAEARKIRLHRLIGERLEQGYRDRTQEIAAELAVHFEQGRDYPRAVQYLRQAGENAIKRSAYREAIVHLTRGLELLKALPDTPERAQHELAFQLAFGTAMITTRGYSALAVEQAFARAHELCDQRGATLQMVPMLHGIRTFRMMQGQVLQARILSAQILELAQQAGNSEATVSLLKAHTLMAEITAYQGEFRLALEHAEQGTALYIPAQRRADGLLWLDHGVACLAYAAIALLHLGYPDQALKRSSEAVALAWELAHPFSSGFALCFAASVHGYRREWSKSQERAEAAVAVSRKHGFPSWMALSMLVQGRALVGQGHSEQGIVVMKGSLNGWRATGVQLAQPMFVGFLAEGYRYAGQFEEGLQHVTQALAMVVRTKEHQYETELYRLKGELILQKFQVSSSEFQVEQGPRSKVQSRKKLSVVSSQLSVPSPQPLTPSSQAEAEAETCFLKAIDIAQKQQAKSLELRATVSLARLWQQQGKAKQAHEMLAEVYNWFTEGFDTKDLQEAKALLEELSH
jgi:DNA-binding winged helix-turn-helix (wHTH) protein/tetratricopeptide (TPR) repeat protein